MSLTVLKQEACQGIGTFTNSAPGSNLASVQGNAGTTTLYKLPGGPRLTGDTSANSYGWSLDMRPEPGGGPGGSGLNGGVVVAALQPSSIPNAGCAQCWLYGGPVVNANNGKMIDILEAYPFVILVGIDPATLNFAWGPVWNNITVTSVSWASLRNMWIKLRFSWNLTSGTQGQVGAVNQWSLDYEPCGQTGAWTNIATGTVTLAMTYNNFDFGFNGLQQVYSAAGNLTKARIGMPTVCSMGSWSDRTLEVPGVVDPPAIPKYTWYWDPANASGTASDSNDGTTAATALSSAAHVGALSQWAGFFTPPQPWQTANNGAATGTALDITQHVAVLDANQKLTGGLLWDYLHGTAALTGDVLMVNNSAGAEISITATSALYLETAGLTFQSSGGTAAPAVLSFFKTIPSSEWSLVSGKTYTYQATDSVAASVLFENRVAMNHPTGANYAAVAAYLESTPGSFWTDGTTMYVHPFHSTNPGTDGNRYERTTVSGGAIPQSGICVSAPHMLIKGITVIGTTLTDPSVGGNTPGYALSVNDVNNSFAVFDTCKSDFGTNHDFAQVASTSGFTNCRFALINCIAQRGGPYATGGAYWAYVDYTPPGAGSGNETVYFNCTTGAGSIQVIGSVMPSNNGFAWGTHGNAGGWQNIFILGCDFSKSNGISAQSGAPVTCADSKFLGSVGGSSTAVFQRCWIYDQAILPGCTMDSCILTFNNSSPISTTGSATVLNHCTLDATAATAPAIFTSTGSNSLVMNQCAVLGNAMVMQSIQSTDTVSLSHNEIAGTSTSTILNSASLGNLTLAQAQSHGLDVGSAMIAAPAIDSITYQRTAQSSVVFPTESLTDIGGVDFAVRRSAGAAEYVPANGVGAIPSGDGQLHRTRQ